MSKVYWRSSYPDGRIGDYLRYVRYKDHDLLELVFCDGARGYYLPHMVFPETKYYPTDSSPIWGISRAILDLPANLSFEAYIQRSQTYAHLPLFSEGVTDESQDHEA